MDCQHYQDLWKKANYLQIDQQLIGFCPLVPITVDLAQLPQENVS